MKWANGLPFFPDFCDEMGKAQMRSNDAEKTLWSRFGTPFASFYQGSALLGGAGAHSTSPGVNWWIQCQIVEILSRRGDPKMNRRVFNRFYGWVFNRGKDQFRLMCDCINYSQSKVFLHIRISAIEFEAQFTWMCPFKNKVPKKCKIE